MISNNYEGSRYIYISKIFPKNIFGLFFNRKYIRIIFISHSRKHYTKKMYWK